MLKINYPKQTYTSQITEEINICSHVISDGQFMTGEDAARVLIAAQLSGIQEITEQGVVVKNRCPV